MKKEEAEIWRTYKNKPTRKKIELIRSLKYHGTLESIDKLSRVYLDNRSLTIRHEAIQVIEYLEIKYSPDRVKLACYDELLAKYRVKSVINFGYKDFKNITIDELDEEVNKYKLKLSINAKSKKRNLRFELTDNIDGIVMLSLQSHGDSYTLQNLTYGFISDFRDIGGGYINNYPFDQKHYQEHFQNEYFLFERERKALFDYFIFVKEHEKKLAEVVNKKPTECSYFKEFNETINFSGELWFILSLVNIQKANGELNNMKKTIEEGLRIQDPNKGGSGWIQYYEAKLNTWPSTM